MTNVAPLHHVSHIVWIALNNLFFKDENQQQDFSKKGKTSLESCTTCFSHIYTYINIYTHPINFVLVNRTVLNPTAQSCCTLVSDVFWAQDLRQDLQLPPGPPAGGGCESPIHLQKITFLPKVFPLEVATPKYLKFHLPGRTNPQCQGCSGPWHRRVLMERCPNLWPCKRNPGQGTESWNPKRLRLERSPERQLCPSCAPCPPERHLQGQTLSLNGSPG